MRTFIWASFFFSSAVSCNRCQYFCAGSLKLRAYPTSLGLHDIKISLSDDTLISPQYDTIFIGIFRKCSQRLQNHGWALTKYAQTLPEVSFIYKPAASACCFFVCPSLLCLSRFLTQENTSTIQIENSPEHLQFHRLHHSLALYRYWRRLPLSLYYSICMSDRRAKDDGHTRTDGDCSSHFPPLLLTHFLSGRPISWSLHMSMTRIRPNRQHGSIPSYHRLISYKNWQTLRVGACGHTATIEINHFY